MFFLFMQVFACLCGIFILKDNYNVWQYKQMFDKSVDNFILLLYNGNVEIGGI